MNPLPTRVGVPDVPAPAALSSRLPFPLAHVAGLAACQATGPKKRTAGPLHLLPQMSLPNTPHPSPGLFQRSHHPGGTGLFPSASCLGSSQVQFPASPLRVDPDPDQSSRQVPPLHIPTPTPCPHSLATVQKGLNLGEHQLLQLIRDSQH